MIVPYQALRFTDGLPPDARQISRLQDAAKNTLDSILQSPVLDCRIASVTVSNAVSAGTDFQVTHGLGKTPKGIVALVSNVAGVVTNSPTSNPLPSSVAILRSSAPIPAGSTLSFLVF